MPGGRKRKHMTANAVEGHVNGGKRSRKDSPTTAISKKRKRTREITDTKDAKECESEVSTLTPKRSVVKFYSIGNDMHGQDTQYMYRWRGAGSRSCSG